MEKFLGVKLGNVFKNVKFSDDGYKFTLFKKIDDLEKTSNTITIGGQKSGEYFPLLLEDGKKYKYNESNVAGVVTLYDLIKYSSDNLTISAKNPDSTSLTKWSSAVWYTALYDLKKKRFQCDKLEYDDNSKRINAIYFSELSK